MDSQINRCIDVCKMREWNYEVYEDFNVSGATLERPGFASMMNDVKEGKNEKGRCNGTYAKQTLKTIYKAINYRT